MDSDTKKIIFLGVVAVVFMIIAVLSFFFRGALEEEAPPVVYNNIETVNIQPLPSEMPIEEEVAPVSEVETEEVVLPETAAVDWRDDVVVIESQSFSDESSLGLGNNLNQSETEVSSPYIPPQPYVYESPEIAEYIPFPEDYFDTDTTQTPVVPTIEMEYKQFPKLRFDSCGSVTAPDDPIEQLLFLQKLESNTAVTCMGKAVADDCDAAKVKARVTSYDETGDVYVAERPDGVCGVGGEFNGLVTLCSIVDIMNSGNAETEDFDHWKKVFATDPGSTFVQMYYAYVANPSGQNVDCVTYEQ